MPVSWGEEEIERATIQPIDQDPGGWLSQPYSHRQSCDLPTVTRPSGTKRAEQLRSFFPFPYVFLPYVRVIAAKRAPIS